MALKVCMLLCEQPELISAELMFCAAAMLNVVQEVALSEAARQTQQVNPSTFSDFNNI